MVIWYKRVEIEPKIVKQYKLVRCETKNYPSGFSYKPAGRDDYRLIQTSQSVWDENPEININNICKKELSKLTIINKDGFEPFQSPVDTRNIITNERERQEDMKRHGCFDARETIPHGKISLLDGQL